VASAVAPFVALAPKAGVFELMPACWHPIANISIIRYNLFVLIRMTLRKLLGSRLAGPLPINFIII